MIDIFILGIMGAFSFIATNYEFHRSVEGKVERDISYPCGSAADKTFFPQGKIVPSQISSPRPGASFITVYGDGRYHLYYENKKQPNPPSSKDHHSIETNKTAAPRSREGLSTTRWPDYVPPDGMYSPYRCDAYHRKTHVVKLLSRHSTPEMSPSSTPSGTPSLHSIPEALEWPDYFMLLND